MSAAVARRDPAARWGDRRFESYGRFYTEVYAPAVRTIERVGRVGATLLTMVQDAGDWSDAPVPDLVLVQSTCREARGLLDGGAGRIAGPMRTGDFMLVAPEVATTVLMDDAHRLRAVAVPWAAMRALAGPDGGLPGRGDFGALHARVNRSAAVDRVLGRLWAGAREGGPHGNLAADARLLELAATLLALRDGRPRAAPGGLAPWQVRRATERLAAHLADEVALADLAADVGLSPFHFARAFKASTGLPPHAYQRSLRVDRARALLGDPRASVTEVASAVGYETPQAFARMFRAATGLSPGAWRRERRA